MGLLRVKVMNQHPLQLCSLLLALADHAYMLVYVPVTQLWSLSVPVVSHYCISTHAEFLNNPSKQYQNSKVSQQKLFFLLQHRSLSCWYPCNLLPYPIQLYPSCFPLQCVLQQPDEKWPGRGGWCEAANRDIYAHSPSDKPCITSFVVLFLCLALIRHTQSGRRVEKVWMREQF